MFALLIKILSILYVVNAVVRTVLKLFSSNAMSFFDSIRDYLVLLQSSSSCSKKQRLPRISLRELQKMERIVQDCLKRDNYDRLDVVGWGEFSLVFRWTYGSEDCKVAVKRLAAFFTDEEKECYLRVLRNFVSTLGSRRIPVSEVHAISLRLKNDPTKSVIFLLQPLIEDESKFPYRWLKKNSQESETYARKFFQKVVDSIDRCVDSSVALDAQVSNWVLQGDASLLEEEEEGVENDLMLLDVDPLMKTPSGKSAFDFGPFIRTLSLLGLIIKWFFFSSLTDKYYDKRENVLDVAGNLIKEGLRDYVPILLQVANETLNLTEEEEELEGEKKSSRNRPLTVAEVEACYKDDAFQWALVQKFRRFIKFWTQWVLWKEYPFIIPQEIKR